MNDALGRKLLRSSFLLNHARNKGKQKPTGGISELYYPFAVPTELRSKSDRIARYNDIVQSNQVPASLMKNGRSVSALNGGVGGWESSLHDTEDYGWVSTSSYCGSSCCSNTECSNTTQKCEDTPAPAPAAGKFP
jgi:hypothetical protein